MQVEHKLNVHLFRWGWGGKRVFGALRLGLLIFPPPHGTTRLFTTQSGTEALVLVQWTPLGFLVQNVKVMFFFVDFLDTFDFIVFGVD